MKSFARCIVYAAILALTSCAHHTEKTGDSAADTKGGSLSLDKDGTGYVTGNVTGNKSECSLDTCYLTVMSDLREVRVLYGSSTGSCPAGSLGQTVVIGAHIKALGTYYREGEDGVVDVCTGRGGFLKAE